jgi:hypothetical protein
MTLMEAMAAFAGAVCSFQIKDSPKYWRIVLINAAAYCIGVLFIGQTIEYRIIYTFVLAWGTFVCKWLEWY